MRVNFGPVIKSQKEDGFFIEPFDLVKCFTDFELDNDHPKVS